MQASSTWQWVIRAILHHWHAQPSNGDMPHVLPSHIGKRLAHTPEPMRAVLLLVLHQRLMAFPYAWVHPTWVAAHLPRDPLVQSWTLHAMPPAMRDRILRILVWRRRAPRVRVVPVLPPVWFAQWWAGYLQRRLGCGLPVHWDHDEDRPLSYLWRFRARDIILFLRVYGMGPLASVIGRMEKRGLLEIVCSFPTGLHHLVTERVRTYAATQRDDWQTLYDRTAPHRRRKPNIPLFLALADTARMARSEHLERTLEYLCLRLPMPLGRNLREYLRREDLPDLPDALRADQHRDMKDLLATLMAQGWVRRPPPQEEVL